MNTYSSEWPSRGSSGYAASSGRWGSASSRAKALLLAAIALAIGLLVGFYAVVAGAVQRAEAGREQQRVALERQFVCSAFSTSSSRDLCLLTVSRHAAHGAVVHALYEPENTASRHPSRGRLTAGL